MRAVWDPSEGSPFHLRAAHPVTGSLCGPSLLTKLVFMFQSLSISNSDTLNSLRLPIPYYSFTLFSTTCYSFSLLCSICRLKALR